MLTGKYIYALVDESIRKPYNSDLMSLSASEKITASGWSLTTEIAFRACQADLHPVVIQTEFDASDYKEGGVPVAIFVFPETEIEIPPVQHGYRRLDDRPPTTTERFSHLTVVYDHLYHIYNEPFGDEDLVLREAALRFMETEYRTTFEFTSNGEVGFIILHNHGRDIRLLNRVRMYPPAVAALLALSEKAQAMLFAQIENTGRPAVLGTLGKNWLQKYELTWDSACRMEGTDVPGEFSLSMILDANSLKNTSFFAYRKE